MRIVTLCLLLCVVQGLFAGVCPASASETRKKLIASGWDIPTAQQLRRDLAQIEQGPFDGVLVEAKAFGAPGDINSCPFREAFSRKAWQREWFARTVADLKVVHSARLTDNFLSLNANPGDVDWFDDAGWAQIVEHMRTAAWVARQGGLKGFVFDPEPYTKPYAQFRYTVQAQRAQHTFLEYMQKARQRGREVMRAVVAEYPAITILAYYMQSDFAIYRWTGSPIVGLPDPRRAMIVHGDSLYPAFIDGWLDAAPPTVTFVDGDEQAYGYTGASEFRDAAARIKGDGQEFVSPQNRAKFRAQVQVGFGLYVDAHVPGLAGSYELDRGGLRPAAMLAKNVTAALAVTDQYVWLWGEKGRWWPAPGDATAGANKTVYPLWADRIPGVLEALLVARDPEGAQQRQWRADAARAADLARAGTLADLLTNGDFALGPASTGSDPADWPSWQDDASHGNFAWDREVGAETKGSARLTGVGEGCFSQMQPIRAGHRYLMTATCRLVGQGEPYLAAGFKDQDRTWMDESRYDRSVNLLREPRQEGVWRQMVLEVVPPAGAGFLVVIPGVAGQGSDRDIAWFDDVHLYDLGPEADRTTD